MDNLVLIRVADSLDRTFSRSVLREVRESAGQHYRLRFATAGGGGSLEISLRPELPWVGRPTGRAPARGAARRGPFGAALERALAGAVLESVRKPGHDRLLELRFAGGRTVVIELATHGANVLLLDEASRVVAAARRPRSSRARTEPGEPYAPPPLPRSLLDPTTAGAQKLADLVGSRAAEGEPPFEALRRGVFGLGSEGARLLADEWHAQGGSIGERVLARLAELRAGQLDPVVLARDDPRELDRSGTVDATSLRLLPWEPRTPPDGMRLFRGADPAATAGLYHGVLERALLRAERAAALYAILDREIDRLGSARRHAAADLATFRDPGRFRRYGEALLAGLGRAVRRGEAIVVPDPYDEDGAELVVPARPGRSVQAVADDCFSRHRRAVRGIERARRRETELAGRVAALRGLRERHAEVPDESAIERLERAMRKAGIPVGLEPATRAARSAARARPPRLEGVRLTTSSDGLSILIGRSGADNQRLTFRLAGAEDFWLHVQGGPGAHVVVRNEPRRDRPPEATLHEAAAAAAWFSSAKSQPWVDVMWTRRKYVRRPRGAAPGTVTVKRFRTVRVRPRLPPGLREEGTG